MDKPDFKLVVAGGRLFNDYKTLSKYLDYMLCKKVETHNIVIVCGEAKGADALGKEYAIERGYRVISMPADWDLYGKSAGYRRNEAMAACSDATVAFWDGESKGTSHMIALTKDYGNKLSVVRY